MKYKIGQQVRIINERGGHKFPIGSVVEIVSHEGGTRYQAMLEHKTWYILESEIEPIEETKKTFKVGDKVRIIDRIPGNISGTQDCLGRGDIGKTGEVVETVFDGLPGHYKVTNASKYYGYFSEEELEFITQPVEKPKSPFKVGDSVVCIDEDCQCQEKSKGEVGEIVSSTNTYYIVRFPNGDRWGHYGDLSASLPSDLKLAPKEEEKPCKKTMYKIGDRFINHSSWFEEGEILELIGYERSTVPQFKNAKGEARFVALENTTFIGAAYPLSTKIVDSVKGTLTKEDMRGKYSNLRMEKSSDYFKEFILADWEGDSIEYQVPEPRAGKYPMATTHENLSKDKGVSTKMAKFNIGDRVKVLKNYSFQGETATICAKESGDFYHFDHVEDGYYNSNNSFTAYGYELELVSSKPKQTIMKKLSILAKKTMDKDTQNYVRLEWLDNNLEVTEAGVKAHAAAGFNGMTIAEYASACVKENEKDEAKK